MEKIRIMVAGLPGKMATLIAEAVASQEDMSLYHCALAEESGSMNIGPSTSVSLIPLWKHAEVLKSAEIDVVVDATLPKSVNYNAQMFCAMEKPFVMLTSGGDRQLLKNTIEKSKISAAIIENASPQISVFQDMIRSAAVKAPDSFKGFKLVIRESHQAGKKGPSGTALSLLPSFAALGMPLAEDDVIKNMVRDPVVQEVEMGIPQQHLGGHGYHTYTMLSPDGTVFLQFTTNILGRKPYIDIMPRVIRFVARHGREEGKVISMMDVLQEA